MIESSTRRPCSLRTRTGAARTDAHSSRPGPSTLIGLLSTGVIMAFWYLAVTIGNLWVLLANTTIKQPAVLEQVGALGLSPNAFLMFFFAGFALICAAIFALYARVYPMQDNYRAA